jgi:hypothetical protein
VINKHFSLTIDLFVIVIMADMAAGAEDEPEARHRIVGELCDRSDPKELFYEEVCSIILHGTESTN